MDRKYTFIDLFCGAGGMTRGFVDSGRFEPVYAVEHQRDFARTYAANFHDEVDNRPIEQVVEDPHTSKIRADVVIGGPPCQGFSNLSLNRSDDPRRKLWQYFMDIVKSSACNVFLMENVPNLLNSREGNAIRRTAQQHGFDYLDGKVLLASNFGVPQHRRRAFIIGSKLGSVDLPLGNGKLMTVQEAFKGIPPQPNVYKFHSNGAVPTTELHIGCTPTKISRDRYPLIPPGGNRFNLSEKAPHLTPPCWKKKPQGGTDVFGRLEWGKPAHCTIRTEFYKPEKGRYLHPEQHRPITHWEAARLQTFPDDYKWCGTRIGIAIQIGNAVPPKLACALADYIAAHLDAFHSQRRLRKPKSRNNK